jgi:hypothetical protein
MVENESLASAVIQCDVDPSTVPAASWERCLNYYFMQFNSWEYMYYQQRDDSIPIELWHGADAYFKSLVEMKPGYRRFWAETGTAFDEPFRSYADQQFQRRPAPHAAGP